jgi:hypothetical protein
MSSNTFMPDECLKGNSADKENPASWLTPLSPPGRLLMPGTHLTSGSRASFGCYHGPGDAIS